MRMVVRTLFLVITLAFTADAAEPRVSFIQRDGQLAIQLGEQPLATYVYRDERIPRPYFAHVKTPGGVQVTRHHPPGPGDPADHATMHPGIWLAFGDISGSDFWRNQARVEHLRFLQDPLAAGTTGTFVEQKRYLRPDGTTVCDEEFRCRLSADKNAYLLNMESIFSSDTAFYFGDQEEMGLGIRVATPLSEVSGGQLIDSVGRRGAKKIWGNSAAWCDYSGQIDGQQVGVTIMCHPSNFGASWFHARDYGLLAANPFGRAAMKQGAPSRIVIQPAATLTLRYAVWIHTKGSSEEIVATFNSYVKSLP